MRPLLVVYATRGGYTRQIAERVADRIRTLAHEVQIQDARTEALPPLERYSAVVLAASVHLGHHGREMVKFVRARRRELDALPTIFLSVSLTEAAAADVHRPDDVRLDARRATRKVLDDFVLETGWRPPRAIPVASALTGTTYGPLTRILMKKLLRREVPDEPAREVVFTDWAALNRVVDGLVREAVERSRTLPPERPPPPPSRGAVEGAVLAP
ncbi:MAG TPA: flavodoxin domain-containing protein [Myxococcaceae bacterium]|nr:flavodoxin domain-containing protein [Myxococcaceae bacterium]